MPDISQLLYGDPAKHPLSEPKEGAEVDDTVDEFGTKWQDMNLYGVQYDASLGKKIEKLRMERGLTLDELVARVNKATKSSDATASTIGQIERGEIDVPSEPMLAALATALGVSKESLKGELSEGDDPIDTERFANQFQRFTPDEQKCISSKISKLRAEGKPEDQAIAQAISQCTNGAKSKPTQAQAPTPQRVTYQNVPGGNYKTKQAADGTWTIYNVPIYSVNKRTAVNPQTGEATELEFDSNWLKQSVLKAQTRLKQDQYLAPLHKNHHRLGQEPVAIGFMLPQRVGKFSYEGKMIDTVFADLIGISTDDKNMIKAGKLPYRSVEIHKPDSPEINSLSVMDTVVPFFRYPNLTLEEVYDSGSPELALSYKDNDENKIVFLMNYKESDMPEEKKDKDTQDVVNAPSVTETEKNKKVDMADDNGDEDENKDKVDMEDGAGPMGEILTLLKAIAEKIGLAGGEEEVPPEAIAPVQAAAMSGKTDVQFASLAKQVKEMRDEISSKKAVDAAYEDLKPFGIEREQLVEFSADPNALRAYVAAAKQHGTRDPQEIHGIQTEGLENCVTKYQGNEVAYVQAVQLSNDFDDLKQRGLVNGETREDFVNNQMLMFTNSF